MAIILGKNYNFSLLYEKKTHFTSLKFHSITNYYFKILKNYKLYP